MESDTLRRSFSVSMDPYSIAIMECFYGQTPLLLIQVQSSSAERTPCRSMLTNLDSVTLVLNCYTRQNWEELRDDLLTIATSCENFIAQPSPYGVKYETVGEIGTDDRRPGAVAAVWIVEENSPPRLVKASKALWAPRFGR